MAASTSTSGVNPVTDMVSYENPYNEMKYAIPDSQRFRARCNMYSHPEVCNDIKNHLSAIDYEKLRRGCMGSILCQGVKLRTNFQLMHHMLLHEVNTCKKREMWFKVDGLITRFSLLEFHVVTGLPCIEFADDPPEDMPIQNFFGVTKCSYSELLEFFKKEPKSSPKKIIMAKLLLVEYLLLYRRSKSVKGLYLSLACDADKFEKYPWGRVSYDLLIKCMMKVSLLDPSKFPDRCVYEMYGYSLGFQVWILEALPSLVKSLDCSFSYVEGDPFSLHWCCEARHCYEQLVPVFYGKMVPQFPTYGEFARKPGMEFEDEVADSNVDYICEPISSQSEEDPIYDVRKVRVRHHLMRYGDGDQVPSLAHLSENAKNDDINNFADNNDMIDFSDEYDLDDYESPERFKKRKIEVANGSAEDKVLEPTSRRGRPRKFEVVDPIIAGKDKKSAHDMPRKKLMLRRKGSAKQDVDQPAGVKLVTEIMNDVFRNKTAGNDAFIDFEDNDACDEAEVADMEGGYNGSNNQPREAGKAVNFADEVPEWANVIFKRLDSLETKIHANTVSNDKVAAEVNLGINIISSLEKRISVLESSVKPTSADALANILPKIALLENRVSALESSSVKEALNTSIPGSGKTACDPSAALNDQEAFDSLPSSLRSLVHEDSPANAAASEPIMEVANFKDDSLRDIDDDIDFSEVVQGSLEILENDVTIAKEMVSRVEARENVAAEVEAHNVVIPFDGNPGNFTVHSPTS